MIRGTEPQHSITRTLTESVSAENVLEKFPFLKNGWRGTSLPGDIHGLMVTYYALLGRDLGYISMAERTIFDEKHREVTTGDSRKDRAPRADSAWYTEESFDLRCLIEFQHWEGNQTSREDLIEKVENMVLYDDIESNIEVLVLHHWDSSDRSIPDEAMTILQRGFTDENGISYSRPDADILILKSRFAEGDQGVELKYTTEREIIPGAV